MIVCLITCLKNALSKPLRRSEAFEEQTNYQRYLMADTSDCAM